MKKFTFFALAAALFCAGCEKESEVISAESISIDKTAITLGEGATAQLSAIVSPENATATVVWSSDNEAVATVDEKGLVTGVAFGEATVTAKVDALVATCAVKVALVYGDVTYKVVTLADGNTWMAENLRYVPEGMTVSGNPADGSGLWYPAGADKVADPSLAATKGLLYNADVAFGAAVTAENAVSMEGVRGICPEGWHIPTLGDYMGLVGKCSKINFAIAGYDYAVGSAPTDPNAICYDATIDGAPVDKLNGIGWNWTNAGVVNVTNVANISKGAYLVTVYEDIVGAMSYVLGSTCYQVQTNEDGSVKNIQYTSLMSTINKSNNKVTVAFGNFKSGYSVRCVKNK